MEMSYNQFLTFTLLYLAHSDANFSEEEKELILKNENANFETVLEKFNACSDAESIEIIKAQAKVYLNTEEDKQNLTQKLKTLLAADGKVTSIENAVFNVLNRLL